MFRKAVITGEIMKSWYVSVAAKIIIGLFLLSGCQSLDFSKNVKPVSDSAEKIFKAFKVKGKTDQSLELKKPLTEILSSALADGNKGSDFPSVFSFALGNDPAITIQKQAVEAKLAAVATSKASKEYQVESAIYGGVEDLTDNTKGLALEINASRLIFDGGLLDATLASKTFEAEAAKFTFEAVLNERAYNIGQIWIELEKYKMLQSQIDRRLAVLNPLIGQLEQVAEAGVGDVSKVTAAQRTVSGIRVTQTNISEGLAKARLEFENAFGVIQSEISYEPDFIRNLIPNKVTDKSAKKSPLLLAKYASYNAALANLKAIEAKDDFNIGFQARALTPFAGNGYDSDESIGFVARKTLFNGGMLESEVDGAKAISESSLAEVGAAYRQGVSIVRSAQQTIESMDKAISLARENAKVTSEEIVYLRQQLIIGGSTLDSVFSAEARLYDAESKEITFRANKRKAELLISATLGLLSPAFDLK